MGKEKIKMSRIILEVFLVNNINKYSWKEMCKLTGYSNAWLAKIRVKLGLKKNPISNRIFHLKGVRAQSLNINQKIEKIDNCYRSKWHKEKWQKRNGVIGKNDLLFYTKGTGTYEELELINKRKRLRELPLKIKRIADKKEKAILREKKWCEDKLKNENPLEEVIYRTFDQHLEKSKMEGKVPIKLNHKTIIFVDIEKCHKDENGNWIKNNLK